MLPVFFEAEWRFFSSTAYEKRLQAIVLIDGGGRPEDARAIPVLILNSGGADDARKVPDAGNAISRNLYLRWSKPGVQITLLGPVHMSFTDLAVIKDFDLPGDGKAFIGKTRAVIGGFFGQHLLGEHSELIEKGALEYSLAKVETPEQSNSESWPRGTRECSLCSQDECCGGLLTDSKPWGCANCRRGLRVSSQWVDQVGYFPVMCRGSQHRTSRRTTRRRCRACRTTRSVYSAFAPAIAGFPSVL